MEVPKVNRPTSTAAHADCDVSSSSPCTYTPTHTVLDTHPLTPARSIMAGLARSITTSHSALCLCFIVVFSLATLSATQPADTGPDVPPVASRLSQPPVPPSGSARQGGAGGGGGGGEETDAGDVAALRGLLDAVAAGNATIVNGVTTAGDPWCDPRLSRLTHNEDHTENHAVTRG